LDENRGNVRIESDGKEHGCEVECVCAEGSRGFGDRQCVEIDDPMENVTRMLTRHPITEGAEIVAEMHLTGRLDAREHASHIDTLVEGLSRFLP
jgi:hypothetical protein